MLYKDEKVHEYTSNYTSKDTSKDTSNYTSNHIYHTPCPPYYFCQALTLRACYICYLIFLSSTYFYTYNPFI